jgi:segregation and condensation protein A
MLELIQQKYLSILTGEGVNNFIIEYNEGWEDDNFLKQEIIIDASLN